MRILSLENTPIAEVRFLNAGKGPGDYYCDTCPVLVGTVDALPMGISAIIATADLQGRETFGEAKGAGLRLLGEVLPLKLSGAILPEIGLTNPGSIGVFLVGDLYAVPGLEKRGGIGDVTSVWRAFGEVFAWVAGVAGNHDAYGPDVHAPPRFGGNLHYLDGGRTKVADLNIAGIGGIIGSPERPRRRSEGDYLNVLADVLEDETDVLLLHDGPDDPYGGQRGSSAMREVIEVFKPKLVIRGHSQWREPLVELSGGVQVLNVDSRIIVLTDIDAG